MTSILDEIYKDDDEIIDDYFDNKLNRKSEDLADKVSASKTCPDEIWRNEVPSDQLIKEEEIVIGIDLGTTNSCVAIWKNKNLEIIPDKFGNRTIPSVVAFTSKSKYIGKEAKKQIEINPENTFYEVKRLIGRKYDNPTIILDKEFLTYKIDNDENNNVILKTNFNNKFYSPEEISSILLMELKHMAEDYLKKKIYKAVITVPAYFNDSQRQATKDAATIAGLECIRIINEPTAAALAYGLEKATFNKDKDINVLVYDLGGGTMDVSLLNISNGIFHVLGSAGNTHLGGSDFDNRLISFCLNEFKKKNNDIKLEDISLISIQKLKQACEEAKKRLSETSKTIIAVKDFYEDKGLFMTITRTIFENLCKDLFILCLKSVDDILKSCEIDKKDIDEIILVGGCTRMPVIRNNLKLFFGGKEPNSSINPDEVVAAGASIQAYIMSHEEDPFSENIVLLDIIPLSLGVETIGGIMNVVIPRNSVIPIKKKKKYTTDSDFETKVNIKVYEGERKMTKDNFFVGEFVLSGIESAPRGISQIEITFSIDINGIINITALDLKNNDNIKSISINSNKGRLTPEKIKELIEEAKYSETKDKLEKHKKQFFYEIEDLCSNIKINVNNDSFKLKDNDKEIVLNDVNKIFDWLKEKNYSDRNRKELIDILNKIKKKYGTLILKVTKENDNVKDSTNEFSKLGATTIYGNEEDEQNLYEELENEELGLTDINNEEIKKEIRRLRETLINLCYSIFDILSSNFIKIEKNHTIELKEYIDDILLWTHVKEKISLLEYHQKIEEVNNICNDIVEKYNSKQIFCGELHTYIDIKRNELEHLCYALMSSILSNIICSNDDNITMLKNKINENLDWLINIDVNYKKAELNKSVYLIEEICYQEKINELNDLCTNIYNSMLNINYKEANIIN